MRRLLAGILTLVLAVVAAQTATAQQTDSLKVDSTFILPEMMIDTISMGDGRLVRQKEHINLASPDSTVKKGRDWATWRPDPKRALWLAVVLPGAGQIYNRKYWKLPIIYGGIVGSIYAMRWNNQMYRDYSQAYLDICDDDPTTQSYNQFLHLGMTIDSSNEDRFRNLFRKRKDYYRRYRDLSFFVLVGVYALSIIDAYVDASLSEFDISDDLSLRIAPAVIKDDLYRNPVKGSGLGIHCALTF